MYPSVRDRPPGVPPLRKGRHRGRFGWIAPNVLFLGLTSLFTDVSSEMVNATLPLYLVTELGFSPLRFGVFDGIYQGMTGLLRIAGGVVADRRRRYKEVAAAGYGLSAACKLGLFFSRTWLPTTALLLADRTGKGIRTAPRDALISISGPSHRMAESFGVHRALDTTGALIGPFLAFVVLSVTAGAWDSVFISSFCIALIGLGILLLFVQNKPLRRDSGSSPTPPSWRDATRLLQGHEFRRLIIAGGLLSLLTVGDAFLYLTYQHRVSLPAEPFPLLFVGTAASYLVLAIPVGRLADRIGRTPVLLGGHVLLVFAYLAVRSSVPGPLSLLLMLGLLGSFYAATDGVMMALASSIVREDLRTSGLAVVTTVTVMARLVASILFGLLWSAAGSDHALTFFLIGLVLAIPAATMVLHPVRKVSA